MLVLHTTSGQTRPQHSDGNTGWGGARSWTGPSHGTDSRGVPVTISFGREDSKQAGQSMIADGHASQKSEFYGPKHDKQHDHYDGKGGSTERGKYSG